MVRKPAPVLKPGDWEKSSNGRQWKPQLGFNRDRRPVHLDQAAFRTLGWVLGFCHLYILLFLTQPQSTKSVFMPQILYETIQYNFFADIFILPCFSSVFKFTARSLVCVYYFMCCLRIPLFSPLKFCYSDSYFNRIKQSFYF